MPHRYAAFLAFTLLVIGGVIGCDTEETEGSDVQGLVVVASGAGVGASAERLERAVDEDARVRAVGRVDFPAASGEQARLVLFSAPHLVTRLLAADPRVGLDLPFGLLVYEDGGAHVAYDTADYLARRYRLDGVSSAALRSVDQTLRTFAATASGGPFRPAVDVRFVSEGDGVVTVPVGDTPSRAYDRLLDALEADDALTPVAAVNFQRDEELSSIEIGYARLLAFEAPALTAPLYAAAPTLAGDLPLKLLVAQDGEEAFVAYDDPFYLAERHGVEGVDDALAEIRALLDRLADVVATAP